jgi:hypothetical protein
MERSQSRWTSTFWSGAVGEAKRKTESVLNGPCPCGANRTARSCCYTGMGWQWDRPSTILGLKALPREGRVEKCYMKELGSCVPPISGEHIISDSVCCVLMGDGRFSISGVPWLEAGEARIMAPPQANCLCVKHNSALSPLDASAHYFFASLRSYLENNSGTQHALVSGHDLERWILKTAKSAAVFRYLARRRKHLSGRFARDREMLEQSRLLHTGWVAAVSTLWRLPQLIVIWSRRYSPNSALNSKRPHPHD